MTKSGPQGYSEPLDLLHGHQDGQGKQAGPWGKYRVICSRKQLLLYMLLSAITLLFILISKPQRPENCYEDPGPSKLQAYEDI